MEKKILELIQSSDRELVILGAKLLGSMGKDYIINFMKEWGMICDAQPGSPLTDYIIPINDPTKGALRPIRIELNQPRVELRYKNFVLYIGYQGLYLMPSEYRGNGITIDERT